MTQYINKADAVAEIERRRDAALLRQRNLEAIGQETVHNKMVANELSRVITFLNTLEVKEVDLEKLGEIARHLIAVKEHIEDMRLNKEEWLMLEKIGYSERFKAQKGE